MHDTNSVILEGRLTEDAVERQSAKGTSFYTFGLAYNKYRHIPETGATEKETSFFNIVFFGKQEDEVVSSLTKGRKIHIDGWLGYKAYTAKDGSTRHDVSILSNKIYLVKTEAKETDAEIPA